jgi:hypothetical protein
VVADSKVPIESLGESLGEKSVPSLIGTTGARYARAASNRVVPWQFHFQTISTDFDVADAAT